MGGAWVKVAGESWVSVGAGIEVAEGGTGVALGGIFSVGEGGIGVLLGGILSVAEGGGGFVLVGVGGHLVLEGSTVGVAVSALGL